MKLTILLIVLFTVSVSAAGFSQNKISLHVEKSAISEAISKIEGQTSYRFLYNENLGEIRKKISVEIEDADIKEALNELFKGSGLSYQMLDNQLIVIQGNGPDAYKDVVISGKVVDSKGEPLIGVSVKVKGTSRGVSTNMDGSFKINVPEGATLVFTYLGYQTREFKLSGQRSISITLSESVSQLDEVVVIGYGAVKKRDVTGSVGSVSSENIIKRGTTSVMSALQGAVPGVDISSNSVKPGASFSVQIRGQNSMNSENSPLFVVDGIVVSNIDFLNPADIEKIDILKDASSTAIYGSRGSNGVVIVQTKNANASSAARTNVTYDGYYGVRSLARIPDFMDGRQWVDFRTSAYYTYNSTQNSYVLTESNKNAVLQKSPLLESRLYNQDYTDWLGLGTQDGKQQNHYVNVAGSARDISYNIGLGYQNEKGNFTSESLDRYNIKLSALHKASKLFTLGANLNLSQTTVNSGSQYGYRDILRIPVILKAYDDDGNLIRQPGIASAIQGSGNFTSSGNPLIEINSGNQEERRYDVLGNVFAQLTPFPGFDIKSTFSPRFNRTRTGRYYGITPDRSKDIAYQSNTENYDYTLDNQLTYNKVIHKDHTINATLINSIYKTRYERIQAQAEGLPYNSEWYNLFSGTLVNSSSNTNYSETSLLSYAARVNYDYKGKYLVTGTIRYDGSSKLADKWKSFPSFALAWRASQEPFLKNDYLSDLKARFSFGYSGNNNGISAYGTQVSPQTGSQVWYDYNGTVVSGFAPGTPVNPNITWEKTRELNYGLDFGFFNQRIAGSLDLYDKLSDGLLMSRTLAIESGVASMTDNIGSVSNKGIEVSLSTLNIKTRNFQWTTSFNFAHNKNAIKTLYGKKEDVPGEARFIGKPINVIYDYNIIGIWKQSQVAEAAQWAQQPGQAIARDINNDGRITAADDRIILGSPYPKWTGTFTSGFVFKNWDLAFNIYTRQGVFVNDAFLGEFGAANTQRGRPKINFDYYIPPGVDRYDWNNWGTNTDGSPKATWAKTEGHEDAKYPAINNPGPYYGGNGAYTDASFVKVRNIIVGYNLPKKAISKMGLSQLRIYANILNPFTFTDYEGWDPEYATTSLQNGNGPSNVTYQFGVNLRF